MSSPNYLSRRWKMNKIMLWLSLATTVAQIVLFGNENREKLDLVQPCGRCCAARISSILRLSPTNFIKCQQHHAEWAQEERTLFLLVFIKSEQKQSRQIACFSCAKKQPYGWCCAPSISSIFRFKPYKIDRMSLASCWMSARRENTFFFVFIQSEQKTSRKIACIWVWLSTNMGRCSILKN